MRTKAEIEERIKMVCRGKGRVYDEETGAWHDEMERELMRNELQWVLKQ